MEKEAYKETIWKLDVSDEFLTFTEEPRPKDFFEVAIKQPYGEFNGTYLGDRAYDDVQFKLYRKLKSSNFKDSSGIFLAIVIGGVFLMNHLK